MPSTPAPELASSSYRGEVLVADAAPLALLLSGGGGNGLTAGLGLAVYVVGSPAIHWMHHHRDRAAESLAVRIALPLLGGLAGDMLTRNSTDDDAQTIAIGLGVIGGLVGACAFDVGYLARAGVDEDARRIMPAIVPVAHGGMTVGLAGSF